MEVSNSCGKDVFQISDIDRLKRFLSLGNENGTYYVSEVDLTKQTINCIDNILNCGSDRELVIGIIEQYATENKCKKQDALVFLLAKCCTFDIQNPDVLMFRKKAYSLIELVCKIPTTLFLFISYCKHICTEKYNSVGWNNLHKRAISNWYLNKDASRLIYQVTKYKDRHKYNHRDVLRLSHTIPISCEQDYIFKYIVKGIDSVRDLSNFESINDEVVEFVTDYERLKTIDEDEVVELIYKRKFAREHVPTSMLNSPNVWKALLAHMPDTALLRNLNKITISGLLDDDETVKLVCQKIESIKGVHPIQVLIALKIYSSGKGNKGKLEWTPDQIVVDVLESKFYDLFDGCLPTGKRVCIAMDVSGSMYYGKTLGTECLTPAEIACALSMVMKKVDKSVDVMGFSETFMPLGISPSRRLDDNLTAIQNLEFSSTDISVPFTWAMEKDKKYDAFIVITDNETNSNTMKPVDALRMYRSCAKIPDCKLIVVALAANGFSIADPNDRNMLDIAGFDATVPDVINEFIKGNM